MLQGLRAAFARVMPAAGALGWPSNATFMARPGDPGYETDALGQVQLTDYAPVDGLENIPCRFAPQSVATPDMTDTRRGSQQWDTKTEFHLLLSDYYPAVQQRYLVVVDGNTYEVMGVDSDSEFGYMTRCAVRAYTI